MILLVVVLVLSYYVRVLKPVIHSRTVMMMILCDMIEGRAGEAAAQRGVFFSQQLKTAAVGQAGRIHGRDPTGAASRWLWTPPHSLRRSTFPRASNLHTT